MGPYLLDDPVLAAAQARARARAARWEQLLSRSGTHSFAAAVVTKKAEREVLTTEAERTKIARSLGEASQLFYTPEVVAIDQVRSTLTIERVQGFVTLRDLLRENAQACIRVANRVGHALGYIHTHLPRSLANIRRTSSLFDVHGDFNTMNVGLRQDDPEVVILDWSAGRHFGRLEIRDPQLFELAHFIYSLVAHHHAPWRVARTLPALIDAFLAGYAAETGRAVLSVDLRREVLSVSRALLLKFGSTRSFRAPAYLLHRIVSHGVLAHGVRS